MILIPKSFTDSEDTYNYSMGWLAQRWPEAQVRYKYNNRTKDMNFRGGFGDELREQVNKMADLRFDNASFDFFLRTLPWLPRNYLQWLGQYRFDPNCVTIKQDGGKLDIAVEGRWYEVIYWEVKLLSTISELHWTIPSTGAHYEMRTGWENNIKEKAERLSRAGVNWIDFGTRRRFNFTAQDKVVDIHRQYEGFRGTSNPYLAMKHGVRAIGTYAHQGPMAMQALYGARSADREWMRHWFETYRGNLGIALCDTLTTPAFLRAFTSEYAAMFTGVRQDSGDPIKVGDTVIAHYKKLGIDPMTKVLVLSDSLSVDTAVKYHQYFKGRIRTTMGIGTHLTHDSDCFGYKPINHVMKLVSADFGNTDGPVELVKLSDVAGKNLGSEARVRQVMGECGIPAFVPPEN